MKKVGLIEFPEYSGIRCLMMPYIQGDPESLPEGLAGYYGFVEQFYLDMGAKGYLTIDEAKVKSGKSQRGYGIGNRTLHTEACKGKRKLLCWGTSPTWGNTDLVSLDEDLQVLIGNSLDGTCAIWDATEEPTPTGDLSHLSDKYPRNTAYILKSGEIFQINIYTPHECIHQEKTGTRQFVRIVGDGVHGTAPHFTVNPCLNQ